MEGGRCVGGCELLLFFYNGSFFQTPRCAQLNHKLGGCGASGLPQQGLGHQRVHSTALTTQTYYSVTPQKTMMFTSRTIQLRFSLSLLC